MLCFSSLLHLSTIGFLLPFVMNLANSQGAPQAQNAGFTKVEHRFSKCNVSINKSLTDFGGGNGRALWTPSKVTNYVLTYVKHLF